MAHRPAKELTEELSKEICTNVSAGMLPYAAAALAGVDRQEFASWMHKAKEGVEPFLTFAEQLDKAALATQRRIVATVTLAATRDPKIGMQFLAMRFPRDWSERGQERSVQLEVETRSTEESKALAVRMAAGFPVLNWESRDEFEALVAGLLAEHMPQGPTEEHLVTELAGALLQKARLRRAEVASHRNALHKAVSGQRRNVVASALAHLGQVKPEGKASEALAANDDETAQEISEHVTGEATTRSVIVMLESKKADRYEQALTALGEMKGWWDDVLTRDRRGEETTYEANADQLLTFLQDEVLPWYAKGILNLKSRPLVREQAFGEAFDGEDMERLSRIDAALDRKLEKILDRLLQLQQARRARTG